MANKNTFVPYFMEDPYGYDIARYVSVAIRREYPDVFESLALEVFPTFFKSVKFRAELAIIKVPAQESKVITFCSPWFHLGDCSAIEPLLDDWCERCNLPFGFIREVAKQTMAMWKASLNEEWMNQVEANGCALLVLHDAFERRTFYLSPKLIAPPTFLEGADRFSLEYPGFAYGYNRKRVEEELDALYKQKKGAYLDNLDRLYDENGWARQKERPNLERDCVLLVHKWVGGKTIEEAIVIMSRKNPDEEIEYDAARIAINKLEREFEIKTP